MTLLENAEVSTRLPAQDLERARAFYSQKLGLESVEEREGGLRYRCGNGYFACSSPPAVRPATTRRWRSRFDDLESVVAELRRRGVVFEEVDVPGLRTVDGIADIEGNYASKGGRERGAWFRDSEANLLGVGQPVR
jgi:catechol 2,3-dioxygenase-like lactoylglutathione lyase family enzyme